MYYRRKLLMALLESFGGKLGKTQLQKLLFLLCQTPQVSAYEFLPYNYGCYSYQANYDLEALVIHGYLNFEDEVWELRSQTSFIAELHEEDKKVLFNIKKFFINKNNNDLILYTYKNYPFYAINSKIAKNILQPSEYEQILEIRNSFKNNIFKLFTIGYEGKSVERFFLNLIKNDIKVLCDVRKNPISQKFGYSKKMLQKICNNMNIEYIHIPNLGIDSQKRAPLKNTRNYNELFKEYYNSLTYDNLKIIIDLIKNKQRVALACFEAQPHQCHRLQISNALAAQEDWKYEIIHLK